MKLADETKTTLTMTAINLDTEFARKNMVLQQVRCWDVSSPRILETLQSIPREHFVPERYANLAFADVMLPLDRKVAGHTRMMLNPMLEGRILQELNCQPTDSALVVGTDSGFLTACIARLTRHVTSIDSSAELIHDVQQRLDDLGIVNVELRVQDIFDQPETSRFDVITLSGSLPVYDSRIEAWLKPGGRAFVVVGPAPAMEACLVEKSLNDEISFRSLFETVIPPLANAPQFSIFDFKP